MAASRLAPDPDAVLGQVRALCLALPDATERPSHGQPSFFAGGRMFAHVRHDHHGDGRTVVCVRTSGPDELALLIDADPDRYARPAYLGTAGWVAIDLAGPDPDWDSVAARIRASAALAVPPRRVRRDD